MADAAVHLAHARELRRNSEWGPACDEFRFAGGVPELDVEDLEGFAECAQILGLRSEAVAALERAFALRMAAGQAREAESSAFWLWEAYALNNEFARANGWMARVRELGELSGEWHEHGWFLITMAFGRIGAGDYGGARSVLARAHEEAVAAADPDQLAFTTLLNGRALIKSGRLRDGLEQLDGAMLRVLSGETSPRVTSLLYCAAIGVCHQEAREASRVREWSAALGAWLDRMPRFGGPFYGNCLTYRAVSLRAAGRWAEALTVLEDAVRGLAEGSAGRLIGHARYELGESHRLLGHVAEAEAAYRAAAFSGGPTQPGLALLRLSLGDVAAALAGMRRALGESELPAARVELLPAAVTVFIAAGVLDDARAGVAELGALAESFDSESVRAAQAQAAGELAVATGDWQASLPTLRRAADLWRALDVPYEAARTSVLLASAYRAVGDEEAAMLELGSAREVFSRLGAGTDLAVVERLLAPDGAPYSLSPREVQVLRLIVRGLTNRAIAGELFLSERTVHRHVSNIFDKLGVSSRTQAATRALDRGIVGLAE
ncbi:helix-turn-helix transcriptional regulator [Sinomonas mesophila]|uniref:helix-turn-helix transcriptional regulator n=1 Tax=Sinomonas mesophila TaxID=1531955 RepID=UPI001FEAD130|nr:response regulator transcription factor [Sinomonas mesophila]